MIPDQQQLQINTGYEEHRVAWANAWLKSSISLD